MTFGPGSTYGAGRRRRPTAPTTALTWIGIVVTILVLIALGRRTRTGG